MRVEVDEALLGQTLSAIVRGALELPWTRAKALCTSGRVRVDGEVVVDVAARPGLGAVVEMDPTAPKRRLSLSRSALVHVDGEVVVVEKPPGISSVPYERGERGSLQEQVQVLLARGKAKAAGHRATAPLRVVQRLDRATSGLLVFARSRSAERELGAQFRQHSVERRYDAIVHGSVVPGRIASYLIRDRGDGLRGSVQGQPSPELGAKHAVTHVKVLRATPVWSWVQCTLETGRTHQIRIHLSEAGHPLVGEPVYIREFAWKPIEAERLMLHAAVLGFEHPSSGQRIRYESPAPAAFDAYR